VCTDSQTLYLAAVTILLKGKNFEENIRKLINKMNFELCLHMQCSCRIVYCEP